MNLVHIRNPARCEDVRAWVYHLQADELAEADKETLLGHLDRCEACTRYMELEESFLRALKGRLVTEPAPEGLAARIRGALERESPTVRTSWVRTPAFSALAAALLLVALLVPPLVGAPGRRTPPAVDLRVLHVTKTVTIVDHDCDAAGHTLAEQLACRNARHLNVLKLGDGSYWNVNLDHPSARDIVLEPGQRGRRVVVEADFYPGLGTARLIRVHEASHRL